MAFEVSVYDLFSENLRALGGPFRGKIAPINGRYVKIDLRNVRLSSGSLEGLLFTLVLDPVRSGNKSKQ